MFDTSLRRFRRMALITIYSTLFLIWVGSWVRSTGSGMGCPDWPTCFGKIVPPTDVSQLPADYKEHYSELRKQKNLRIAARLEKMGFTEVAEKIINDPKVYIEDDFNPLKTWTEYVNRLFGVLVGLFITLTMVFSFPLRKYDKRITTLSILGFILVLWEGWLGSIVVSTKLMPGMITLHMLLAILLIIVLINAYLRATPKPTRIELPALLRYLGVLAAVITFVQTLLGTQLRESIDRVAEMFGGEQREVWLVAVGTPYVVHRVFYYMVGIVIAFFVYKLKDYFSVVNGLKLHSYLLLAFTGFEIIFGIAMYYLAIPQFLQPLHLLFSTLIFVSVYYITYMLFRLERK